MAIQTLIFDLELFSMKRTIFSDILSEFESVGTSHLISSSTYRITEIWEDWQAAALVAQ